MNFFKMTLPVFRELLKPSIHLYSFAMVLGVLTWLLIPLEPSIYLIVRIAALSGAVLTVVACHSNRVAAHLIATLTIFLAMMSLSAYHLLNLKQQSRFKYDNHDILTVSGTVVELPKCNGESCRFILKLSNSVEKIVVFSKPEELLILPGGSYELSLKVKQIWGYANPHSSNQERFWFFKGVGASGRMIAGHLLEIPPWYSLTYRRYCLSKRIAELTAKHPLTGVMQALVVADKSMIDDETWQRFMRSGTSHLIAISGLHISLVAGFGAGIGHLISRRYPFLLLRYPYGLSKMSFALAFAFIYALLSGLSLPTLRALLMLIIATTLKLLKWPYSIGIVFSLSLALCTLLEPMSLYQAGFWLSFVAVFFVIAKLSTNEGDFAVHSRVFWGLMPITWLFFGEVTLFSVPANIIAIPWMSLSIVPLALLGAFLSWCEPIATTLFGIALWQLDLLSWLLDLINKGYLNLAKTTANAIQVAALMGCALILVCKGLFGRYWALLGIALLWQDNNCSILENEAQLSVLDVGQGLSLLVQTKNHTLLYDTGGAFGKRWNAGQRIVSPFLKGQGVKAVDHLMISHMDLDHVGGLSGISLPISVLSAPDITKFDKALDCHTLPQWEWDGVSFKVLPLIQVPTKRVKNNGSCVLLVQTKGVKLLLTGDIEEQREQELYQSFAKELKVDILLVPHHGSKTSSSLEFLKATKPKYAIIPVGRHNHYGHPHPTVLERYQSQKIQLLSTITDGAILIKMGQNELSWIQRWRIDAPRAWQLQQGT